MVSETDHLLFHLGYFICYIFNLFFQSIFILDVFILDSIFILIVIFNVHVVVIINNIGFEFDVLHLLIFRNNCQHVSEISSARYFLKRFSLLNQNLALDIINIIFVDDLLQNRCNIAIFIQEISPISFPQEVASTFSFALINKESPFIKCAVIYAYYTAVFKSKHILSDSVYVKSYIQLTACNKYYLFYFFKLLMNNCSCIFSSWFQLLQNEHYEVSKILVFP